MIIFHAILKRCNHVTSLSENLYRRLTLSKYLFGQARRIFQQSEPYSGGLATSLLHDSVEVFLRVLTEHFRIKLRQQEYFNQLFEKVCTNISCVGDHSAGMNRLNKARVGFKHEGLDVSRTDVEAFLTNVEAFLSEVCEQELSVDFTTLSLVKAIGHRRTQNWLDKASEALRSEHYTESVAHSAAAMAIYLYHRDNRTGGRTDPSYYIDFSSTELGAVADWVLEYVEPIRFRLDLVSHGIDVASYDKFEVLTPGTSVGRNGMVIQHKPKTTPPFTRDDARFCYDFTVNSALALRDIEMPAGIQRDTNSARACVTSPCELIVHPDTDPIEVIRVVQPNEELLIAPQRYRRIFPPDHSEFVPIIQDGDVAYVRRDCLEDAVELPK